MEIIDLCPRRPCWLENCISGSEYGTTTMLGTQASMLVISSVDYQHSGVYTCRAENPAGVTTHSAELKVNGISTERH